MAMIPLYMCIMYFDKKTKMCYLYCSIYILFECYNYHLNQLTLLSSVLGFCLCKNVIIFFLNKKLSHNVSGKHDKTIKQSQSIETNDVYIYILRSTLLTTDPTEPILPAGDGDGDIGEGVPLRPKTG